MLFIVATTLSALPTWRELAAKNYVYSFDAYLAETGKNYMGPEYTSRKAQFELSLATIKKHNSRTDSSYKMGLSMHTDKTDEEFRTQMKGYNRGIAFATHAARPNPASLVEKADLSALAENLDWRDKKVVTPVKDQGGCGSCWAFSATETVESAVAMATGKLVKMAPQEYVDCAPNPKHCGGSGGCQGSTQWLAFNHSIAAGIIAGATEYPYKGRDGTCEDSKMKSVASITGYERIMANDYTSLMSAVANYGPIAISVSAAWRHYSEGVYDDECGTTIDHAVQLVGYGTDDKSGDMYWLVRNSWGTSWGEEGYIRIKRFGEGNEPCGVDKNPSSGTGCTGGPDQVTVCGLCGIMSDSSYPTGASLKE